MDECMLNDLLECSVCLERLDTSSKVLPCQHTFCKRCLEEIVTTHKELRCPECRILVEAKIDDLPPNVLLMRILEGMRNAPKKGQDVQQQRSDVGIRTPVPQIAVTHNHMSPNSTSQQVTSPSIDRNISINKPLSLPHQPYGRALYDFSSSESNDLNFKKGDIVLLKKRMDMHWYLGECGGKQGVFPSAFIQVIVPLPCHIPQCKALYDFRMTGEDEEGCLAFSKGAIINVIRRVDENWAEGRLNDRVGIFPLAFVELNGLARSLMKLSTNSQPGPSRVAPPTPTAEENSTPLILNENNSSVNNIVRTQQINTQQQQQQSHPIRQGSESSSTMSSTSPSTTPNTSSSNTSSSSSTAPSSPTSPPPRTTSSTVNVPPPRPAAPHIVPITSQPHTSVNQREKRHSFSALNTGHHHHSSHRHSAEILSTSEHDTTQIPASGGDRHRRSGSNDTIPPPVSANQNGSSHQVATMNLPAAYIALYPYTPQKSDELELRKGGIYMVTERCQDGWFKGTSNRTQKCGVFPGNYVAPARGVPRGTAVNILQTSRNLSAPPLEPRVAVTYTRSGKPSPNSSTNNSVTLTSNIRNLSANSKQPPELPPRSVSPATPSTTVSCSWHGQPENNSGNVPLGRSQSAVMSPAVTPLNANIKAVEKSKERKEKGSLMRRLTSMKRSKSPPPLTYSMDNPVFEDTGNTVSTSTSSPAHPVHVRSGSCPSQLLQALPADTNGSSTQNVHQRFLTSGTATGSQRIKHKERAHVMQLASVPHSSSRHAENSSSSAVPTISSSPNGNHHRKSNSLDAGSKTSSRTRFRCIVPYPPNSEYELELRLNDIIYVQKKRDDGWYKGTQLRTGRTGLFPASFVESF